MFRTVIVNNGEKISLRDNWVIISTSSGESSVPLEDIYSMVIDNQQAALTVPVIHRLTSSGAHLLICNEKHIPVTVILPHNTYFHPLTILRYQMEMTQAFKDSLWDRITAKKITNQARVLGFCGREPAKVRRLLELAEEVTDGDSGNREGIAAKMFFREMYGTEFVRMNDDAINAALNYGYAVIRSAVCKTLCAHGYNCVIGLHHISEADPFNLAEDIMEPLRPVVDMWVDDHIEELDGELTRSQRTELAAIINDLVIVKKRKMRIRTAIDEYVRSLTTAITRNSAGYLELPEIIRTDIYNEED